MSTVILTQHILKTLDPNSKPLDPFPVPAALVVLEEEPPRNFDPPVQSRIAPRNLESCRCRVEPAGGQLDWGPNCSMLAFNGEIPGTPLDGVAVLCVQPDFGETDHPPTIYCHFSSQSRLAASERAPVKNQKNWYSVHYMLLHPKPGYMLSQLAESAFRSPCSP